ncbi:MAG: Arm DNA-binding domain-containing protein [Deltaproteobacteria bacterium]|jgi:hypothetical protein|nr:Arm DNA-binding domain-containing protein [Deltaproteobacteria bacterium]
MMPTLNNVTLSQLEPQDKKYRVKDNLQPGLFLEVLPSGLKMWRLMTSAAGARRQATLGSFPEIGLSSARERACRKIEAGPAPRRRAEVLPKTVRTFGDLAKAFLGQHCGRRESRNLKLWRSLLGRSILPSLGRREICRVTPSALIVSVFQPLLDRGESEAADSAREVCCLIFRFGLERGLVKTDPTEGLPEDFAAGPSSLRDRLAGNDPMQLAARGPAVGSADHRHRAHHYHVRRNPLLLKSFKRPHPADQR